MRLRNLKYVHVIFNLESSTMFVYAFLRSWMHMKIRSEWDNITDRHQLRRTRTLQHHRLVMCVLLLWPFLITAGFAYYPIISIIEISESSDLLLHLTPTSSSNTESTFYISISSWEVQIQPRMTQVLSELNIDRFNQQHHEQEWFI